MPYLPAYRLKLYRNFKALGEQDFHGIIRYYEQHEDGLRTLDLEEYLDCTLAYADALFETAQYGKHIVMCDHLLELLIRENIDAWGGQDLYTRTLARKAAAHFQLGAMPKAEHILRELVKMHPNDSFMQAFLQKCLLQQRPGWLMTVRATTVVLVLLAVVVIAVELFVLRPFFPDYYSASLLVHNTLLGAGIAFLAGGECWHHVRCRQHVKRFAHSMQARKMVPTSEQSTP